MPGQTTAYFLKQLVLSLLQLRKLVFRTNLEVYLLQVRTLEAGHPQRCPGHDLLLATDAQRLGADQLLELGPFVEALRFGNDQTEFGRESLKMTLV